MWPSPLKMKPTWSALEDDHLVVLQCQGCAQRFVFSAAAMTPRLIEETIRRHEQEAHPMESTRMSLAIVHAEQLDLNVVRLPNGQVLVQMYAPGVGDVNMYFPCVEDAKTWELRVSNQIAMLRSE